MPVYVDEIVGGYERPEGAKETYTGGGEDWCHLMADTSDELEEFRQKLRLSKSWLQHAGTKQEHYDLTPGKRYQALRMGALPMPDGWLTARLLGPERAANRAQQREAREARSVDDVWAAGPNWPPGTDFEQLRREALA
jgi:hypothetical protein